MEGYNVLTRGWVLDNATREMKKKVIMERYHTIEGIDLNGRPSIERLNIT